MDWRERIEINPAILVGKPIVKGTRLAVELLLDLVAAGCPEEEVLRNYPGLTHTDILACIAYAAEIVRTERVYPRRADDKDFGELAFRARLPATSGIVLFRLVPPLPSSVTTAAVAAFQHERNFAGLFVLVEAGRVRERTLPHLG